MTALLAAGCGVAHTPAAGSLYLGRTTRRSSHNAGTCCLLASTQNRNVATAASKGWWKIEVHNIHLTQLDWSGRLCASACSACEHGWAKVDADDACMERIEWRVATC